MFEEDTHCGAYCRYLCLDKCPEMLRVDGTNGPCDTKWGYNGNYVKSTRSVHGYPIYDGPNGNYLSRYVWSM